MDTYLDSGQAFKARNNLKCPYVTVCDDDKTTCECHRAYCPFSHSLAIEENDSSSMDIDESTLESRVGRLQSDDEDDDTEVINLLEDDESVKQQDIMNSEQDDIIVVEHSDYDSDSSGQLHIVVSSDEHSDKQDEILPSAVRNKKRKQRIIEFNTSSSSSSSLELSPVSKSEKEGSDLEQGETQNLRREERELQNEGRENRRHRSPEIIRTSELLEKYTVKEKDVRGKNFSCVVRLSDFGTQIPKEALVNGSVSLPLCGLEQSVPLTSKYRARKPPISVRPSSSGEKLARKRRLSNGQLKTSGKHSRLHGPSKVKRPDQVQLFDLFGDDDSDDFQVKRIPRKPTPAPNRDKSSRNDPRNKSRKERELVELQKKYISQEEVKELDRLLSAEGNTDELRKIFDKTQKKMRKAKRQRDERTNSSEPSTIKATVVSDVSSSRNGMSGTALSDVRAQPPPLLVQKRRREAHSAAEVRRQHLKTLPTHSQRPAHYRDQLAARREQKIAPIRLSADSERNLVRKPSKPVSMVGSRSPVAGSSDKKKVHLLQRSPDTNRFMNKKPTPVASSISNRSLSVDSKSRTDHRIVVPSKQNPRSRVAHASSLNEESRAPTVRRNIATKIGYQHRQNKLSHMYKVAMELYQNHTKAAAVAIAEEEKAALNSEKNQIYIAKIVGAITRLRRGSGEHLRAAGATKMTPTSPPPSMKLPAPIISRQQQQHHKQPQQPSFPAHIVRQQHHQQQKQAEAALQQNNSNLMKVSFNKPTRIAHGSSASSAAITSSSSSLDTSNVQPLLRESLMNGKAARPVSSRKFFEDMLKYIMNEEQLEVNGYPRPTGTKGRCCFRDEASKKPRSVSRRKECIRCTKEFTVSIDDPDDDQDCYFHSGRLQSLKVGTSWEKRYSCCHSTIGSSGCTWSQSHVHADNKRDCTNYVQTKSREPLNPRRSPGVFAVDCEMCYTVEGFELTRVSVVSHEGKTKYDRFVKPKGRVLDYNTKYSGVEEKDLENATIEIEDVQRHLLRMFTAETILVGHSLESDLVALKMIHSRVVDTSIVFPHRLGPPLKRALRNLMVDTLGVVIQSADNNGHDSTEDAVACLQLMHWKIKDSKPAGEA